LELASLRADGAFVMKQFAMSERRACKLVELDRSSYRYEGQPVIQASVVSDCLKVDSLCDNTDPADKTDPRRSRYHRLSHPETGRTYDSVCNRPLRYTGAPIWKHCPWRVYSGACETLEVVFPDRLYLGRC
jgi:hypothetical protein